MKEDRIEIKDLLLRGIIGINDWEREKKQDILVNIVIFADLKKAGETDDIAHSVNYRTVAKRVIKYIETSEHYTVETLAAKIAHICVQEQGVLRARVRVEKPGALRFAKSVGVEIERGAEDFA